MTHINLSAEYFPCCFKTAFTYEAGRFDKQNEERAPILVKEIQSSEKHAAINTHKYSMASSEVEYGFVQTVVWARECSAREKNPRKTV